LKFGSLASGHLTATSASTYTTWASGALGARLGAGTVKIQASRLRAEEAYIKRNGVNLTWSGTTFSAEYAYSASDYYEIGVRKAEDFHDEYKYDWVRYEVVDIIEGEAYWAEISSGTTGWTTSWYTTDDLPSSASIGTKKNIYWLADEQTVSTEYSNNASITLSFESANSYPAGFVFVNTDGSYTTLPYTAGYIDHDTHPIVLNSWASASNKPYINGDDLISGFASGYPVGQALSVAPASSSASMTPVGGSADSISSVATVINNGASITFISASDSMTVNGFGGNGTAVGVYSVLAASVVKVTQSAGVTTESIMPANANVSLGSSGNKMYAAHVQNFYGAFNGNLAGNVNSSGTSNTVWGAVFN
jgi:hypothetical protein